ncbi:lycopene cyclase domain-containing protein [Brachybacterium squillarum]|uniref:lycopene cyclase domain-containing protein n=1 Tax=Brachybacterium squillarum TaxID=661979 RepID=UPI0002629B84|nr:lycopene cyclase domain-containing protein [Brachybacterium squillarum]
MDPYQYLIVMGLCLAITLPLEWVLRARVYRRWRLLLPTIAVVVLVFGIWDLIAISRDHWTFSPLYTTGITLGTLPIEELSFFIVIPLAGLLSYEASTYLLGVLRGLRTPRTERTDERDGVRR